MMKITIVMLAFLLSQPTLAAFDFSNTDAAPGNMRFAWIHGSLSAKANTDARVQVHRYNEHTYILRQNPAIHWEAPFMYLLFGEQQALLLDTGATQESELFPLRETVDALISRWETANNVSGVELTVLQLGSEFSQIQGLSQFEGRAKTTLMPSTDSARKALLGSNERVSFDLGGRELTVLKTPGLDSQAITLYDAWTDLMFTGNTFYAGRLVIRDFDAYKNSLKTMTEFLNEQPVKWVMGGRIEMSDYPGVDYRLRSNFRPREHSLQMPARLLQEGYDIVHIINGKQDIRTHDEFIVMNGVGRGARDYGWPTYTPERFRQVRLR